MRKSRFCYRAWFTKMARPCTGSLEATAASWIPNPDEPGMGVYRVAAELAVRRLRDLRVASEEQPQGRRLGMQVPVDSPRWMLVWRNESCRPQYA